MKIKTFEFCVNCTYGSKNRKGSIPLDHRDESENARRNNYVATHVSSLTEADRKINKYLEKELEEGGEFVSMSENFYTAHRHNNGYDDTVVRSVTIITK